MRTTKIIIAVLALALMGAGCSKTNSQAASPIATTPTGIVAPVIVDPNAPLGSGSGSTASFSTGGSTATFAPLSLQTMTDYVATHPLNNPTNFKINVNLAQADAGRYGGTISISYTDNGMEYNGVFKAGMGRNQSIKGMYDNNTRGTAYAEPSSLSYFRQHKDYSALRNFCNRSTLCTWLTKVLHHYHRLLTLALMLWSQLRIHLQKIL